METPAKYETVKEIRAFEEGWSKGADASANVFILFFLLTIIFAAVPAYSCGVHTAHRNSIAEDLECDPDNIPTH